MMLKDFRLLKNILLKKPVLCLWQITAHCNFSCQICTFWREVYSPEEELTLAQIETVVEKLKPLAPMMISLAGGEPLLREDLPAIVKIVSKYNYCSIITNGWYMTRDLANALYQNGMRDAIVSIDYATPERHDAQRGKVGAFSHAVAALEFLRDARPDDSHKIRVLAVLLDDNIDELEGLMLLAEELSVSFAITLYSDHLGKKPNRFPKQPVSDYLLELKHRHPCFDSATEYIVSFDRALLGDTSDCGGGRTFININQRGLISRCVDRYDMPAANPLTQSLSAIQNALKDESKKEPCKKCWTSCRGLADVITGLNGIKTYPDFFRSRRHLHR
jgi:MoaA/NifB/PqqE/SkfB family radical SAM enzyme